MTERRDIVLEGKLKALTPLHFTLPTMEKQGQVLKPVMQFIENEEPKKKIVIPVNSLRGAIRHSCASLFLKKFYEKTENKIDYMTYLLYAGGGAIVKKEEKGEKSIISPEDYLKIIELTEKTLVLSLFGGSLPYPVGMIEGRLRIAPAVSNLDDDSFEHIRLAKTEGESEYFAMIAEGKADSESYVDTITKTAIRNVIEDIYIIPQGTEFEHKIELRRASSEELALILHALKEVSKKGIGGLKRFLFGKLAMTYWIYDRDYEAKISIQEGTIEIEENAKFINDIETQLEKYWNSLSKEEWESFTYESIEELIKKALKKTNRKKEEAKDEV
ncbi:MAG: RAMP superfamily CRISPR-associated protein [Candidatus Aenigmatarchaeota archaeon]